MNKPINAKTQIINGTEYVYLDRPFWDPQKKASSHKRIYIGKNLNGEFVPNKYYQLHQELDGARSLLMKNSAQEVGKILHYVYGPSYLLDKVLVHTDFAARLHKYCGDHYKLVMSIIYYWIIEGFVPLSRIERWSEMYIHPFAKRITKENITDVLCKAENELIKQLKEFILERCPGFSTEESEYMDIDKKGSISVFGTISRELLCCLYQAAVMCHSLILERSGGLTRDELTDALDELCAVRCVKEGEKIRECYSIREFDEDIYKRFHIKAPKLASSFGDDQT